jgi:hypothetical protein
MTVSVCQTIIQQIRSIDPYALMAWGAKDATDVGNGLRFKTSGMTKWKGFVVVKLNQSDLYDVEFLRLRKVKGVPTIIMDHFVGDVFCDSLVATIDSFVG